MILQLSNTISGLKFAMEKNESERLKSSSGKKRNNFVANPITGENFRAMIYYDFRRGLSKQECIDQLISTFGD